MVDSSSPRLQAWTAVAMFVTVTLNILWTLDKGIIFKDEAFYLLHFRADARTVNPGSWHIIFRPFFVERLVPLRLLMFFLFGASSFFLGVACAKPLHLHMRPWVVGILAATAQFVLWTPVQFIPTYLSLNGVAIFVCVGSFLLSRSLKGAYRIAALGASGFFMGAVPFLMITNSGLFLVLLLAIAVTADASQRRASLASFLAGNAVFIAMYFTLFEGVAAFMNRMDEARFYVSLDGFYRPRQVLDWHVRIAKDFSGRPLALALCAVLIARGGLTNKLLKRALFVVAVVLAAMQLFRDLSYSLAIVPVTLWYVLIGVLVTLAIERAQGNREQWTVVVLLALTPYFGSMGTLMSFEVRAACYFAALFLAVVGVVHISGARREHWMPALALFLVCYLNFFTFNFREGWGLYKKVAQDQEVRITPRGGSIYLDAERRATVENVRPLIEGRRNVVVSDPSGWGYVYLAGASPLYLYFRFNERALNHFLEQEEISVSSLLCIEDKTIPFPEGFRRRLVENAGFRRVDLGAVALYIR